MHKVVQLRLVCSCTKSYTKSHTTDWKAKEGRWWEGSQLTEDAEGWPVIQDDTYLVLILLSVRVEHQALEPVGHGPRLARSLHILVKQR